ncbi:MULTISPECIES: hypothetical protein [Marinovum]|uniref:hypothetical protein n=1 Tax=Marinovum TaxID=367771 RepID=UPI00237AA1A5|nr:hypothetical protein [Marinovum sp. PR37]MDD9745356.1 hypothetical protein [Marinovum sp. PR37]
MTRKPPTLRPDSRLSEWLGRWRGMAVSVADPDLPRSNAPEAPPAAAAMLGLGLRAFDRVVLPKAVSAAIAGCKHRFGWVAGPPIEEWEPIALHIDAEARLWLAVQDYETDEYAMWIVGFDDDLAPRRLRRAPDLAGAAQPPLPERGDEVLTF